MTSIRLPVPCTGRPPLRGSAPKLASLRSGSLRLGAPGAEYGDSHLIYRIASLSRTPIHDVGQGCPFRAPVGRLRGAAPKLASLRSGEIPLGAPGGLTPP